MKIRINNSTSNDHKNNNDNSDGHRKYIYIIRGSPQLLRALKPEILERQVFDIGGLGCRATFRVPGWVM